MRSYKKKKKVAGNDIMELDLGLGGTKNARKKKDMEKENFEKVVNSPKISKARKEKPSKGAQQMATTKK
jgi:hypothetical protein